MKQIISKCKSVFYPIEPDNWKKNLEGYDVKIKNLKTLEDIVIDIDNQNNEFINVEENELVNWLNELFKIIRKKPELYDKIIYDKYKIFPCQEKKVFSNLKYCKQIRVDPGISEYIKNITIESDDIKKIDIYMKKFLKNNEISNQKIIEKISKAVLCVKKESKDMIELINSIKGNNLEIVESENKDSEVEIFSEETLDVAIENCPDNLLSLVEKYSELDNFKSFLKEKEKCFDFLNKFYEKLKKINYNKFYSSWIIPNCKGQFKKIKELYGNKIEEDELYLIYKKLGKTFDDSIIHKEINLDDLSNSYTDKDVAKGIEDYYIKLFVFDKLDINRVDEDTKAISIGLFDWMEKNEKKVQKIMEYFKDKINRARLLDLTVVNTLHEKSKFYDKYMEFFESEEDFKNFLKNFFSKDSLVKSLCRPINSNDLSQLENNHLPHSSFNESPNFLKNNKVYINKDDLPETFRVYNDEELLRKIGDAGEKYAFEYLIEEFKKKGFIPDVGENDLKSIKLKKKNSNDFVEIELCDTINFKQPGYDIRILINENGNTSIKYIEVKTHTTNSILSGKIKLSYQQYCMSRINKNYGVIVIKALFVGNEIKCKLNKIFDPFYSYEGKEVRPEEREYNFEFDE